MTLISLQQRLVDILLVEEDLRGKFPPTPWHPPVWTNVIELVRKHIDENPGVIEDDSPLRDWWDSYRLFVGSKHQ
jgi:hypothetical protein